MNKFKLLISCIALISSFFLSGCSTIVGSKTETFTIASEPTKASVSIIDKKNNTEIYNDVTPFTVTLNKKNGYFSGKDYTVVLDKKGFNKFSFDIRSSVNGWYAIGNLGFGGLIGWLIVDPLTGSMWNLVPEKNTQIVSDGSVLTVKLLSDLTDEQKARMIKIK